ncbi:MAG: dethiobiotin synthase [Desulfobacterales bacterium]|nr:dethiobiotin synthase [Desulfobacterales bacterium]
MKKGIFITGTDTDVGKTIVTAGIAGALKKKGVDVAIMKPVASGAKKTAGGLISDDVRFLMHAIGSTDDVRLVNPVVLEAPVAPWAATLLGDGTRIDPGAIKGCYDQLSRLHDFTLVEGIGGLLVPLTEKYWVLDMIKDLNLSVVVVSRPGLGAINHSLLTIRAAISSGIEVMGFIISGRDEMNSGDATRTNPAVIETLSRVPLLGVLPFDPKVDILNLELGDVVALTWKHIDLQKILAG